MKKKLTALVAVLLAACMLTACTSTQGLKKVPQGDRPESMDMASMEPKFPSDSSIKNQLMTIATEMKSAKTMEEQKELYDYFLHEAFIYIVGPYNYTQYLAADGNSVKLYYDNMINHMNLFLSEYDVAAWSVIGESSWGIQLKAEYDKLMCTPNSVRNSYPVSDEAGKALTQSMYDARDAYIAEIEEPTQDADMESLLDDVLSTRESMADSSGYDSYLDFIVTKRDRLPYKLSDLKALAAIVRDELAPAVSAMNAGGMPALSAQQWNDVLPKLAARFPEYEQDLSYVLENGVYSVQEGESTQQFVYMLYQYDVSAGKAIISGSADAVALAVLKGLGLEARNMTLDSSQWSLSSLALYDQIQSSAFAAMCINQYDAIFGSDAQAAQQASVYYMAQDVCRSAMELEYLVALYDNPVMSQGEREALLVDLCAQYGIDVQADYLTTSMDVLLGGADCASRMLGGLYGLQLHLLDVQNPALAQQVLGETLKVYNAANPISAGYKAGLANPFSADGVKAIAQVLQ